MEELTNTVQWRPIPGMPDYFACETGEIGTTLKWNGHRHVSLALPRIVDSSPDGQTGYPMVYIRGKLYSVHRLVARAFHGEPPEGTECGHLDGSRDNSRPENLAWVTKSENQRQRWVHQRQREERAASSCANNLI